MDLSCSVVIVEQCVSADKVVWQRFGWDYSALGEVSSSIKWFKTQTNAAFSLAEFQTAIDAFERMPKG